MASHKESGDVKKKRPSKAADPKLTTEDHNSKNCCICCEEMKFFAIGACDHPICCKCSARMRVLANQTYCATCRAEMKQVVVCFQEKKFIEFNVKSMKIKRGAGFCFEEWRLADYYDGLFDYGCSDCSSLEKPFGSFDDLKTHIRRAHEKQFCQICLDALSNFPSELKMYTKKELVTHRKEGDSEDRSHRGHPECKFCNDRFVDNDTLLFHLRKSHFWCHFCEHDGKQEYYNVYKDLRTHFGEHHFLCDEGDCRYEKFTSVFRDKIDYQAHKLATHGKNFNKMQAKEARKIEFDYSYRKRQQTPSVVTGSDYAEVNSGEQKHPDAFNNARRGGNQNTLDFSTFEDVERERQELKKEKEKENRTSKRKSPDMNERSKREMESTAAAAAPSGDSQRFRLIDDDDIIGLPEHINKPIERTNRSDEVSKPVPAKESSSNKKNNLGGQDKPKNKPDNKTEHRSSPNIMEDFPSLHGGGMPSPDLRLPKKAPVEDFPALGKSVRPKEPPILQKQTNQKKSEIIHMNGIPVTVKKKKEKGKSWTQQSGRGNITSQDDFPSLQSIDLNQNVEDTKPNVKPNMGNKTPRELANGPPSNNKNDKPPPGLKEQPTKKTFVSNGPPGLGGTSVRKKDDKPPGFASNKSESMEDKIRERNLRLVTLLQTYLDDFNLQIFKNISGDFRKNKVPASEYYSGISELLGDNLKYLFSELVALLPDEKKREELLKLHQNAKILAKRKEDNKNASTKAYTATKRAVWGSTPAPAPAPQTAPIDRSEETWCADCGEAFSRDEAIQHMESHGEAFPSLPTATRKTKYMPFKTVHQSQAKNPWTR